MGRDKPDFRPNLGGTSFAWIRPEEAMTDGEARRDGLATWMLELSVLWGVLPIVDQLLATRPLDTRITAFSSVISLTALGIGVMLKRGERR